MTKDDRFISMIFGMTLGYLDAIKGRAAVDKLISRARARRAAVDKLISRARARPQR